ncbi:MAG: transaldolase [Anaerolineae bacterium]|nr:transaldolase [Anaerolineae bacterium]MCB9107396.1 transaldolase [Anaerolineales bacterium]
MQTPITQLVNLGQSIWYDNIERRLLQNGELAAMIGRGDIRGLTSNPSIFNNAIAKSTDYDADLLPLAKAGKTPVEIFEALAVDDIRAAADLLRPLYNETNGGDGYVSLEVNPTLAHESEATLSEAKRLWAWVDRPNLMIKIPATIEGLPAIRQAIAAGINVNVTLIFSIERYQAVMDAYLSGLEDRLAQGLPLNRIASVASFFVSRIDVAVDRQLEALGSERAAALLGKTAIANARLAYQAFKAVFNSDRFAGLKAAGAQLQRPLWASTGTKNPAYSDTLYVDELIGPHTVNTMPPATLDAFRDHGQAALTIEADLAGASQVMAELAALDISLDDVTRTLEVDGVKAFADAFASLLATIERRCSVPA